jgi:uncharacterized protein (TIGR02271 family)
MSRTEPVLIADTQGVRAQLLATVRLVTSDEPVALLKLESGELVAVPETALAQHDDGSYRVGVSLADSNRGPVAEQAAAAQPFAASGPLVVPVMVEEVEVHKRTVETGKVLITKVVEEHDEVVDEPLLREELQIERVPKDRRVEGPIPVRQVDDTTIVSIVAEEIVVTKHYVLKEELHIRKRMVEAREPVRVTLRSEKAIVERVDPRAQRNENSRRRE